VKRTFGLRPQSYWGPDERRASSADSANLAQIGTDIRNVQTFGKLAGALISSITDMGTFITTTNFNRLSYWEAIKNLQAAAQCRRTRATS
jgi:hypothetical protein